jgi:hypothetical protein
MRAECPSAVMRERALAYGVHPDHDHVHRPFIWLNADEADLLRTTLCRGLMPGSYQVTPVILGRRRATRQAQVRPADRPDRSSGGFQSQPAAGPRTYRPSRTSPARSPRR